MVKCAGLSYAAADFALSLKDKDRMQVERVSQHYSSIATTELVAALGRHEHNREAVVQMACTSFLLLSCAVIRWLQRQS